MCRINICFIGSHDFAEINPRFACCTLKIMAGKLQFESRVRRRGQVAFPDIRRLLIWTLVTNIITKCAHVRPRKKPPCDRQGTQMRDLFGIGETLTVFTVHEGTKASDFRLQMFRKSLRNRGRTPRPT